jgi:anti-sigma regulatory factor (Ser/Thr protein kinase)
VAAARPPTFEHLALRRDMSAPSVARRWIVDVAHHLPDDRLDDARLILTELVCNSLAHAGGGGDIEVTAHVSRERLRVTVYDGGARLPWPSRPTSREGAAAGCWGLVIVDELADLLEVDARQGAVSFELATAD